MSRKSFFPRPGSMTLTQTDGLVSDLRKAGLTTVAKNHAFLSDSSIRAFYHRNSHMFSEDEKSAA